MEYQYDAKKYVRNRRKERSTLNAPLRVVRLFVLCIIIPATLLTVPLYMRFRVYKEQVYPVGASDMRLLDNKISTTWCQSQQIQANTTFNAFVLPGEPEISPYKETINMRRFILLKDGSKEYWGFYLLAGSSFKVSSCVRWPGASMFVIEGHKNLKECAYLGDNSSEELEDSFSSEEDQNVTVMERMTKILPGIILDYIDPANNNNNNNNQTFSSDNSSIVPFPKSSSKEQQEQQSQSRLFHQQQEEREKAKFNKRLQRPRSKLHNVHLNYAAYLYDEENQNKRTANALKKIVRTAKRPPKLSEIVRDNEESYQRRTETEEIMEFFNENVDNEDDPVVVDDLRNLAKKLQSFGGERKKTVLKSVNSYLDEQIKRYVVLDDGGGDRVISNNNNNGSSGIIDDDDDNVERLSTTRKNNLTIKRPSSETDFDDKRAAADRLENIEFSQLRKMLLLTRKNKGSNGHSNDTADSNESNAAEEEHDEPADVRGTVNSTKGGDRSKSEYWSSISSSEERLLQCKGLLVSLPLIPHRNCDHLYTTESLDRASDLNSIYHRIVNDGYYFFVFNNENEVKDNFIHIHFVINKTVYDTSKPVATCKNQSGVCSLPLTFWSHEKTVLELPVPANQSHWNEEFIVVSTCEPRAAVYLICIISVPIFIVLFAFQ